MYKQSRGGGFGSVSARIPTRLPENYSGNAFQSVNAEERHEVSSSESALLPAVIPFKEASGSGPLSALGNMLSGDGGLLLLVLLILAAGGGKQDDGALIMILLLLCL